MKITFFRFNIDESYWNLLEQILKNNDIKETALRECLKHCSTNFIIEKCSRYVADQITDGRDIYSHQSQRYVNFKDKVDYSKVDFFYMPEEIEQMGQAELFRAHTNSMIDKYCKMVDVGIPPEDARFFLPGSFYSNIKITLHGERLLDFIIFNYYQNLKEHEDIANALLDNFKGKYDILVEKILTIVKSKKEDYENEELVENLWKSMLKSGQFNVFYHNNPVLEASLGASICYRGGAPSEYIQNFDTEKQETLLKKIIASKHESTTEHAFFTIQCSLSRIIHQQLRRHRIPTRSYTSIFDAADNFSYVIPPKIQENDKCRKLYIDGMDEVKSVYDALIERGVPKEAAGYLIPNGVRLDILLTTNLRDIKHILRERLCERAQWEIRELAYKIFAELYKKSPLLFSDLGPSCYLGKCKEGEFCCGRPYIFKDFVEGIKGEIK